MANPFAMFKTDAALESEKGIVLDYGDFRYRIGRAGGANKRYAKLLEARMKPHQRVMSAGQLDEDVAAKILAEVFAETVIFDAEVLDKEKSTPEVPVYKAGLINENGEIIEDNVKNRAAQFLALPELFADIRSQANNFSLFLAVKQEEIVGN